MTLSVTNTKALADISITHKNSKDKVKHFDIKIEFNAFRLKGKRLVPNCRYGFTEFYFLVKMSSTGEILNCTETNLKKFSKEVLKEKTKDVTWKADIKSGITETATAGLGRDAKSGNKASITGTFEEDEPDLSVLRKNKKLIRWRYKDFSKIQRDVMEDWKDLFFEWNYSKMPITGKIEMEIEDADFHGITKEIKNWQKPIAQYLLERQENISLENLNQISQSIRVNE